MANGNAVTPVNLTSNTAGTPIPVGVEARDVAITPDGNTAYVTVDNAVRPINTANNTAGGPIDLTVAARGIAITPDGDTAYVAAGNTVRPINTANNTAGAAIDLGAEARGVAITPDGTTAYVTAGTNAVRPVNTANNTAGGAITVGDTPQGIAVAPDGATAYAANFGSNSVTPINTANNTPGNAFAANAARDVAITPDQAPQAKFTVRAGAAGAPTSFDASTSTVRFGTIASYAWNFGDGSTQTTTAPVVSHVYARAGNYTATLTETSSNGTVDDDRVHRADGLAQRRTGRDDVGRRQGPARGVRRPRPDDRGHPGRRPHHRHER